ncbi:hypothetical protein [Roseisalinus antarcticus]|uniref:Thiol:disulfide interchange protein DsbD N-terminal domain-containing protein n=1 Tax=Roseisalinus antarcticus TaxID=254357 RepID=A0A1Y5SBX3_9RHOB|nr:hypothetical protein [Roseisalinus antarcticus]SLN36445.1 hypothetical protein ROA7023_01333 [Roseisalinus antarcticus]
MRLVLPIILAAPAAFADPPEITAVTVEQTGAGWQVSVTLLHPDTGWEHYADAWRLEAPDGTPLGTRELLHPHETEQPFTRSLTGVTIPPDLAEVHIRARCNTDGWNTGTTMVPLDQTTR